MTGTGCDCSRDAAASWSSLSAAPDCNVAESLPSLEARSFPSAPSQTRIARIDGGAESTDDARADGERELSARYAASTCGATATVQAATSARRCSAARLAAGNV